MTDPLSKFKFHVEDGVIIAKAKVGRSMLDGPPPSVVERLAGLEDAKIAERNRKVDKLNADLEAWRRKTGDADQWCEVEVNGVKTRARVRLEYREE